MSLSPNVTPFVPRGKSTTVGHASGPRSSMLKFSADVVEFVPSWLNNRTSLSQDHAQKPSDRRARKRSSLSTGVISWETENNEQVAPKSESNTTPSKPETPSTKVSSVKEQAAIKQKKHHPKAINIEDNKESDFPALGVSVGHGKTSPTIWNKQFGVSFSDKLKANQNTSYFYNEPLKPFMDKKKDQNMPKGCIEEHENNVEDKLTTVVQNVNRKATDSIPKLHSDEEGFLFVQNNSKKNAKVNDKHKPSGSDMSQNWRSGRNVADNHKAPIIKQEQKKDLDCIAKDKGSSRTKQTIKSTSGADVWTRETRPVFSYSDILKSKPNTPLPYPVNGKQRGVLRMPNEGSKEEVEEQQVEAQEGKSKKKKKKQKKKSSAEVQPQPVKKSKEVLTLDFGDMLTQIMESSAAKKKPVIRTGGMLPAQAPLPPRETRVKNERKIQASNVLDSTAPIVFRSKEREVPKKKKPSAMRKILMEEREQKKMAREGKLPTEQSLNHEVSDKETSEEEHSDSDDIDAAEVKKSLHSRKFREYCDHDLDYDINGVVIQLLKELIRFQDRLYQKDPQKAKARRRFVCGLREVHKHAKLKKLKCVIVTPNLEPTKSKGGLDDLLSNIIDVCHSQNVPVIFSLNRQVLGKILLKKVPVSIVGIFYYDGAQDHFKRLMTLTEVARETYKDKFNKAREKFLLEKQMKRELARIEAGLHSAEIQRAKDEIMLYNNRIPAFEVTVDTEPSNMGNLSGEKVQKMLTKNLFCLTEVQSAANSNNPVDVQNVGENEVMRSDNDGLGAEKVEQMFTKNELRSTEIQKKKTTRNAGDVDVQNGGDVERRIIEKDNLGEKMKEFLMRNDLSLTEIEKDETKVNMNSTDVLDVEDIEAIENN